MIDRTDADNTKNQIELSSPIGSSPVYAKNQTGQDMTNHIDLVNIEIETELLGHIWLGSVSNENQIGQWLYRLSRCILYQKWYWTVMTNQIEYILSQKPDKTTTWPMV